MYNNQKKVKQENSQPYHRIYILHNNAQEEIPEKNTFHIDDGMLYEIISMKEYWNGVKIYTRA